MKFEKKFNSNRKTKSFNFLHKIQEELSSIDKGRV